MIPHHPRYGQLLLALLGCVLPVLAVAACGDDDDGGAAQPTTGASSTTGAAQPTASVDTITEPDLPGPVSQYSILLQDVGIQNYLTDLRATFEVSLDDYAGSPAFDSEAIGKANLTKWGYIEGYQTGLIPEGRNEAILNGSYLIYHEVHLFKTVAGAEEAYDYFVQRVSSNGISQPVTSAPIGNESFVAKAVQGKIGNVDQSIHSVIFRRGNLVVVLQAIGADPLMRTDYARASALIIDAKALGTLAAATPTPSPTPTVTPTPR